VDMGVTMSPEVLEDKLEEAREGKHREATWNTKRPPTRLTPGWTNRLYVACRGYWRGYFPLSGDVLWNPQDEVAPVAMLFDASRWTRIKPVEAPRFRGWRYLETPPASAEASAGRPDRGLDRGPDTPSDPGPTSRRRRSSPETSSSTS